MQDEYGRNIDYMRISLTDRCNLRCAYCMPDGAKLVPMAQVLRSEEILECARAAASLGICHIKVTGGEPFVRRGADALVRMLKELPGIETVTLTTNGLLLEQHLEALKDAAIDGINISLDTTGPQRYALLSGIGKVSGRTAETGLTQEAQEAVRTVVRAVRLSAEQGIRTKINAVSLESTKPEELLPFAKELPVDVRFIEMMPIGCGKKFAAVDNRILLGQIRRAHPELERDPGRHGFGPAVYYKIPGYKGSVGFISAVHGKFCSSCSRVRLTSMGYLKTCLCYEDGADLRAILRGDGTREERFEKMKETMAGAIMKKRREHCFDHPGEITESHLMASIGG